MRATLVAVGVGVSVPTCQRSPSSLRSRRGFSCPTGRTRRGVGTWKPWLLAANGARRGWWPAASGRHVMSGRTCSIRGCDRKHCARDLCRKHYMAAGHGFQAHQCRVPGCVAMTTAKTGDGLCEMHYGRLRRTGTLAPGKFYKPSLSPAEILWERSEPHGDCILWTGSTSHDGYGSINIQTWGASRPHRYSWTLAHGPIPAGMEIDHLCHNEAAECVPSGCIHRRCINPDHLEMVTHDENMRRQFARLALQTEAV